MNYKMVSYVLGWVLKIEAGCMLLPLICAFIYNDYGKNPIILSIILCLVAGILLSLKTPKNKTMYAPKSTGAIICAVSIFPMNMEYSMLTSIRIRLYAK